MSVHTAMTPEDEPDWEWIWELERLTIQSTKGDDDANDNQPADE